MTTTCIRARVQLMSSPEPAPYLVRRGAGAEEEGRRELAPPEPGDGGDEESDQEEAAETRHGCGQPS
jgi:hypothetical protein